MEGMKKYFDEQIDHQLRDLRQRDGDADGADAVPQVAAGPAQVGMPPPRSFSTSTAIFRLAKP